MTKVKMYRYLGRNGIITSRVLLDGISHIALVNLLADEGKILTNGKKELRSVIVELEDEDLWREISDNNDK